MSDTAAGDGLYLGIDVGTGSARAGLFDGRGTMLGAGSHPIQLWRPEPDWAEQSSDDIWSACGVAVRAALGEAGAGPEQVAGIGFDATCSLVAMDKADRPLAVGPSEDPARNVIVWMDHRAIDQAERINATRHPVLDFVGGRISPEMETPKLLWLKENRPQSWAAAGRFLDLPDFLVWRATGADTRSLCSTVCKWTYLGHEAATVDGSVGRWDASYFQAIGLGDLADEGFERIGRRVRPIAEPVGKGLTAAAAAELGLRPGTPVGVSIIDAHAGGLGVLGAPIGDEPVDAAALGRRLALIGGTSSCHLAVAPQPIFVPGVWGPYHAALLPELWLAEGGQSVTGALIDHVIQTHARGPDLTAEAEQANTTVYALLNDRLAALGAGLEVPAALTRDLHVLPDFHGNRSPRADPTLRGAITGLTLDDGADALARLYLATVQAVAYGTRHIIDEMNGKGYAVDTILATGGGSKNPVFLQAHADATGCRIVLPAESEAVLLGGAVMGAVAAGRHAGLVAAMAAMNRAGQVIEPAAGATRRFHDAKYRVFLALHEQSQANREVMREAGFGI